MGIPKWPPCPNIMTYMHIYTAHTHTLAHMVHTYIDVYMIHIKCLFFSVSVSMYVYMSIFMYIVCVCVCVYIYIYFKNTKNLFIHIALIPEGDNPRVNPNILKCLLHSPVTKGYRLVVIASRAMVCKTPTYYLILNSLTFARGCVILRSHILFPLLLILLISHHI